MDNELLLVLKVALIILGSVSFGILISNLLHMPILAHCAACNCVKASHPIVDSTQQLDPVHQQ